MNRRGFVKRMTALGLSTDLLSTTIAAYDTIIDSEEADFTNEFVSSDIGSLADVITEIAPIQPTYHLVKDLEELETFELEAQKLLKLTNEYEEDDPRYEEVVRKIEILVDKYVVPVKGDIVTVLDQGNSLHGTDYRYLSKDKIIKIEDETI